MNVPFVDLYAQYLTIKPEIDSAISEIIKNTSFIGGKSVKDFEKQFAAALGVKHCISVANGTDAIYIALKMSGIGAGDEVITTSLSWIATSETISLAGAKPVFVDIDEYFTMDTSQIVKKITSKTKAIIPVHLYGQACQMDEIVNICKKYNLLLIEDCAQSHFTKFNNQYVGTFGRAATFSFYPGKNLGAYGDAGCIVTNDDLLAEKMKMFANHGALKKHVHQMEGINSRLDGIQAAILLKKLPHIFSWTESRRRNAELYYKMLSSLSDIELPSIRENSYHTYHLFVIRTSKRDLLQEFLSNNGIQTAIHYPVALPFMPAYNYLQHIPDDFRNAYKAQNTILSLPMYPELSEESIIYVSKKIKEFFTLM